MLIVEPGMITRYFNLWNIKEERRASPKETKELIESGDLSVKYFQKEKMVGINLSKKANINYRLFEPNEK